MENKMCDKQEDIVDVLNDLIRINHDRITGYEKASDKAKDTDADLKSTFQRMAEESSLYASELTQEVVKLGGEPATGTTNSGKIYRVWMDVKATFTGKDREAILASCEHGEDAAQAAYKTALESGDLSFGCRELVTRQKAALKTSHDTIKRYRDMQNSIKK